MIWLFLDIFAKEYGNLAQLDSDNEMVQACIALFLSVHMNNNY